MKLWLLFMSERKTSGKPAKDPSSLVALSLSSRGPSFGSRCPGHCWCLRLTLCNRLILGTDDRSASPAQALLAPAPDRAAELPGSLGSAAGTSASTGSSLLLVMKAEWEVSTGWAAGVPDFSGSAAGPSISTCSALLLVLVLRTGGGLEVYRDGLLGWPGPLFYLVWERRGKHRIYSGWLSLGLLRAQRWWEFIAGKARLTLHLASVHEQRYPVQYR